MGNLPRAGQLHVSRVVGWMTVVPLLLLHDERVHGRVLRVLLLQDLAAGNHR